MSANPPQPDLVSHQGSSQGSSPNPAPELPPHSNEGRRSEAESEDDGFVEKLHVDTYISRLRPPSCRRRRRDQVLLCVPSSGNRVCRRTIPVLASERIQLLFECEERNLRRVMDVPRGLHFFSYCTFNIDFGEFPSSPSLLSPPRASLPEVVLSSTSPTTSWMLLRTSACPLSLQPPGPLLFDLERALPTMVACCFAGPIPLCIRLQMNPVANLSDWLPTAAYHYLYITSSPDNGRPLSLNRRRTWD